MTLKELQTAYQQGKKFKYLFFWGHQPTKNGSVTASCLSQWWKAPFTVNGVVFSTAEHWMMHQKALLFDDKAMAEKISKAKTPGEAKKYGRLVKNFDPVKWDERKFDIVVEGNRHKFQQHSALKDYLLNLKNRVIVEASPVDRIWGIGMAKDNEKVSNPLAWKGQNLLGFALMEVRDALDKEMQVK